MQKMLEEVPFAKGQQWIKWGCETLKTLENQHGTGT